MEHLYKLMYKILLTVIYVIRTNLAHTQRYTCKLKAHLKSFLQFLAKSFGKILVDYICLSFASLYNLLKFSKDELRNVKTFLKC